MNRPWSLLVQCLLTLLWIYTSTTIATTSTSNISLTSATTSSMSPELSATTVSSQRITSPKLSTSSHFNHLYSDEAFCQARFLSAENGSSLSEGNVGVAVVLELRRPDAHGCGAVSDTALQIAAALIWAVRRLNGDGLDPGVGPFIPGLRIDMRIYDDCSHSLLAARYIGELLSDHPDFNCTPAFPPIAGILGTTVSHTTTQVASLLADSNIPQFGLSATLSDLSDKTKYPTFYRTVPSDLTQSKVLVDLVKQLNWTYIAGVYTRDNYGTEGFQEFKRQAALSGICVFNDTSLWRTDDDLENTLESFIRELLNYVANTRFKNLGVVYFGQETEAAIIFQMIEQRRSRWHFQDKLTNLHWLFTDGVGTSSVVANMTTTYPGKLISISPDSTILQDVHDFYLDILDTPEWLGPYGQSLVRQYLHNQLNCPANNSVVNSCGLRDKIITSGYISAALDSLYSLALLLGRVHSEVCEGAGIAGICQEMLQTLDQGLLSKVQPLKTMNYSYFSAERLPEEFRKQRLLEQNQYGDFLPANSSLYLVHSATKGIWIQIGEYSNGSLTISSDLTSLPPSACGTDCRLQCVKQESIQFIYRPGDVILLGLYSVSKPGEDFACGDYRKQSSAMAALLAFLRTVEVMMMMQAGTGSDAPRINFGALVLDDCYSRLRVSGLIADLFSGKTKLQDPSSEKPIDMKKVVAVVGSQSSSVTLSALNILTPLELPTISYSATSPDLNDRSNFPYFLRSVPSDDMQARALLDIVLLLNVSYVGFLRQDNNYGLRAMQQFVKMANEAGVCVEVADPVDDNDAESRLLALMKGMSNKDVKVVVAFMLETTAAKVLDAISNQKLGLIFLASEAWGVTPSTTLNGTRGVTARGSLVLTVDSTNEAVDVDMANYLRELTMDSLMASRWPWMREFWENLQTCNLPAGFTSVHPVMCQPGDKIEESVVNSLAQDQRVVQTVNAVATIITALNQRCRNDRDPVSCVLNLSAPNAVDWMRNVTLVDPKLGRFQPYLRDGNGNVGFALHNVQKTSNGNYNYVQIGKYDPKLHLLVDKENIIFYDPVGQPMGKVVSTCKFKKQCAEICDRAPVGTLTPVDVRSDSAAQEAATDDLVAAVAVLALLCGLLLGLLTMIVYCACRRRKIPCLGVVKKDVQQALELPVQTAGVNGRWLSESEADTSFHSSMPRTSPRTSQPLPPIPGLDMQDPNYNVPSDLSSRSSITRSSGTSASVRTTSPDVAEEQLAQSDQFRSQYEQQERWRQLQERGRQHMARRGEGYSPTPSQTAILAQERPRASSVPHVQRPTFLPLKVKTTPTSITGGGRGGVEMESAYRPRSKSHDSSVMNRLESLSENNLQILLESLLEARRLQSPGRPRNIMRSADIAAVPTSAQYRPNLTPVHSQTSLMELAGPSSPTITFANPPSFCSSRTSLDVIPGDNPSFLYLHPVSTSAEPYLQLLPNAAHYSPPHGPADRVIPFDGSETNSRKCSAEEAPATSPVEVLTYSSNSMTSLVTSVRGSTASESSGAVFVSPDQEHLALSQAGVRGPALNEDNIRTQLRPFQTCFVSWPQVGIVHQMRKSSVPSSRSLEQNQVFSPGPLLDSALTATKEPFPHNSHGSSSVGQSWPTLSSQSSPFGSLTLPTLEQYSPQNNLQSPSHSQQSSPLLPGMIVRDSAGVLYVVPQYMPPTQQEVHPMSTSQALDPALSGSRTSSASEDGHLHRAADRTQASGPMMQSGEIGQNNSLSGDGAPLHTSEPVATPLSPPIINNLVRVPRMGVDALSAQRKIAVSSSAQKYNLDQRTLDAAGCFSEPRVQSSIPSVALPASSSTNTVTTSVVASPNPDAAEASDPALSVSFPHVESIPYIPIHQLMPEPAPCRFVQDRQVVSSSASDHNSWDSGTGEDLPTLDSGMVAVVL